MFLSRLRAASRPTARPARVEPLERRALLSAGDLDPTFGDGGKVLTDFPASASEQAKAIVVQPDGKYVVAGGVAARFSTYEDSAFGLVRYNPDGSLDTTFGDGGRVLLPFGRYAEATGLALSPGGKIVAAGKTRTHSGYTSAPTQLAVARLNADGSPDDSFDGDGRLVLPFGGRTVDSSAVAVQPDGRIVLAASLWVGSTGEVPVGLVRLNTDGTPDNGFGGDGMSDVTALSRATAVAVGANSRIVVAGSKGSEFAVARFTTAGDLDTDFAGDGDTTATFHDAGARATAVTVMPDGRIVAAGTTSQTTGQFTTQQDVAVARFNADGTPDRTFSDDGRAMAGHGDRNDLGMSLAVTGAGAVWVGGRSDGRAAGGGRLALFRLTAAGTPDPDFDADGALIGQTDWSEAAGVVAGPDGSAVVAGYVYPDGRSYDIFVARYTATGAYDATFNGTGTVTTDFTAMSGDLATAVVVQPDGKALVGGTAHDGRSARAPGVLMRYNANGTDDPSFGVGGVVKIAGSERLVALALQPDGKIISVSNPYDEVLQRRDWLVQRFNPDGSVDGVFGQGGRVTFSVSTAGYGTPRALAVQPDGRILVAGDGGGPFAVVRLLPDGAFDPSFGTGGKVLTQIRLPGVWGGWSHASSIALATDGKIVLAGPSGSDYTPTGTFAVARYHANGRLDTSFGSAGWKEYSVEGVGSSDEPLEVAATASGSLYIGTTVSRRGQATVPTGRDFLLMRLWPSGGVDTAFGGTSDGKVFVDFAGGHDVLGDLVLLPDSIVAVGTATTGANRTGFGVARYTFSGLPVASFGTGGKVTTEFAGATELSVAGATGAALAPGGRLVVAGSALMPLRSSDFAVARYLLSETPPRAGVAFATLFYNNSAYDGYDPAAGPVDDAALAAQKSGQPAGALPSFDNVTNYSRGINGVMIDVANLPAGAEPTADDFVFRRRAATRSATWSAGPRPVSVTVRRGAGLYGTDRVTLVWADYDPRSRAPDRAVANGWLEVTMRATGQTGLAGDSAFRFGNLVGDLGPDDAWTNGVAGLVGVVSPGDYADARAVLQRPAGVGTATDVNRDGRVNVLDLALIRGNNGRVLFAPQEPVAASAAAPAPTPAQPRRRSGYVPLASQVLS